MARKPRKIAFSSAATKKKLKWNPEQVEALEHSIDEKWLGIVKGEIMDRGSNDCKCCSNYRYNQADDGSVACLGCPIAEFSGIDLCIKTPYEKWLNYWLARDADENGFYATTPYQKKLARAELNFLREVLAAGT